VLASPLHLSDSPQRLDRLPAVGEDTDAILRELGYSDAEIAALRKDEVI
jgi:formyl-CoA transferase